MEKEYLHNHLREMEPLEDSRRMHNKSCTRGALVIASCLSRWSCSILNLFVVFFLRPSTCCKNYLKRLSLRITWYLIIFMKPGVGFDYNIIHACKNDCIIFWQQYAKFDSCLVCHESRWKSSKGNVPQKSVKTFNDTPSCRFLIFSSFV